MPLPDGEPHYGQIIKADKIEAWEVYPEVGWDPHTQAVNPDARCRAKSASSARAMKSTST